MSYQFRGFLAVLVLLGWYQLRIHCGLWRASAPRPPPDIVDVVHDLDGCFSHSQPGELTFADMETFEATF